MTLDALVDVGWRDIRVSIHDRCFKSDPKLNLSMPLDEKNAKHLWRPPLEMADTVNVNEVPGFKSLRQFRWDCKFMITK